MEALDQLDVSGLCLRRSVWIFPKRNHSIVAVFAFGCALTRGILSRKTCGSFSPLCVFAPQVIAQAIVDVNGS
jgi:hypothetical protein